MWHIFQTRQAQEPRVTEEHHRTGATRSELAVIGLACSLVAAAVAWLNGNHELQSGVYHSQYLRLVDHFRGELPETLLTYPLWGYPLLLSVLPRPETTSIVLQELLAVGVLLFVYARTRPHLRHRWPLALLTVFAVPWWALASVKLADSWAAGFGLAGILALVHGFQTGQLRWGIGAGIAFGASVNTRSDFLPFLVALSAALMLVTPATLRARWQVLAAAIALAILLLLPWGFYRAYHGYSFGITSTNAGMVLYNSLGFAGNEWGIVKSDRLRGAEVREALDEGLKPYSEAENRYLQRRAVELILSDPLEYLRGAAHSFLSTLRYSFYGIEIEPYLQGKDGRRFEVLKEQLKVLAGGMENQLEVQRFREKGLWEENFSLRSLSLRDWGLLSVPLISSAFGSLYLVALLLAVARLLICDRTRLREPLFFMTLIAIGYFWTLICLLQYEQRQANILYPLGLPSVALAIDRLRAGTKRNASGAQTS